MINNAIIYFRINSYSIALLITELFRGDLRDRINETIERLSEAKLTQYNIHFISTEISTDYVKLIKDKDPYFVDTIFADDIDEFITKGKKLAEPRIKDLAGFINNLGNIGVYSLNKTLYYMYADNLEKNNKKLFKDKFESWEHGPVNPYVHYLAKHSYHELINSDNVFQKDSSDMHLMIKAKGSYDQYGEYFEENRFVLDTNPTHRDNTPWKRAFVKGENRKITDDDIIKYHKNEHI